MKQYLAVFCCWIAIAFAVCVIASTIAPVPFGPLSIVAYTLLAVACTAICIFAEADLKRGIRTGVIGFVILCIVPLAEIRLLTWQGVIVAGTATSLAIIATYLLWNINLQRKLASCVK